MYFIFIKPSLFFCTVNIFIYFTHYMPVPLLFSIPVIFLLSLFFFLLEE